MDHLASIPSLYFLLTLTGCHSEKRPPIIAVIPQVAPEQIWLDEHAGVLRAASKAGVASIGTPLTAKTMYSANSPCGSIAKGKYAALVLAPAQQLALMLPVKRVLARKLPVVIVSSPLTLPPGDNLAYIVSDEDETVHWRRERSATSSTAKG